MPPSSSFLALLIFLLDGAPLLLDGRQLCLRCSIKCLTSDTPVFIVLCVAGRRVQCCAVWRHVLEARCLSAGVSDHDLLFSEKGAADVAAGRATAGALFPQPPPSPAGASAARRRMATGSARPFSWAHC